MREKQVHTFKSVYDENSKILILGTFPSVKSREEGFYYGHKQNRFWRALAGVLKDEIPETIEEKKAFLLKHNIALWDVASSCEIENSADSTIKNVMPNDIKGLIEKTKIECIFLNGKTALKLYEKFFGKSLDTKYFCLPSTSPANAAFSLEKLQNEWQKILDFVQ